MLQEFENLICSFTTQRRKRRNPRTSDNVHEHRDDNVPYRPRLIPYGHRYRNGSSLIRKHRNYSTPFAWVYYNSKLMCFLFIHKETCVVDIKIISVRRTLELYTRGGSNEYTQSMFFLLFFFFFWAEIRKTLYTHVNLSFTIWKWGLRGSKLDRYVFVMKDSFMR